MLLRRKTLVIIGATLVGLVLILYLSARVIMLRGFAALEEMTARQNMDRAIQAFLADSSQLKTLVTDWATWDDSYAFMENGNEEYIKSNLLDQMFLDNKVNVVVYVSAAGRVVFSKAFDLHMGKQVAVPPGMQEHLRAKSPLVRSPLPANGVQGLLRLPEGPMLVVARPIVTSDGKGPPRGSLIMGRYVEFSTIEGLAERTHLALTMCLYDDPNLPPDFLAGKEGLAQGLEVSIRQLSKNSIAAYACLQDIYRKPAILLRMEMPREIYKQGQASLRQAMLSLVGVGVIFGMLNVILLEAFVLSPLARLSRSVSGIGERGDLSARVTVAGKDELANLAGDINRMLQALEKSEAAHRESEERYRTLVETSPDAIWMTDAAGNLIMANQQAAQLHGFRCVDAMLSHAKSILDLLAPEDRLRAEENMNAVSAEGAIRNVEYLMLRKDGGSFPAELSLSLVSDADGRRWGFIGVVRDITARKEAERRIGESEEKYRTLFQDSLEAMSLTRNGKIIDVNAAWLSLHGFTSKAEVVGRDVIRVVHPDDHAIFTARRNGMGRGSRRLAQMRDVRTDGSAIDVELYSSSIVLRGEAAIITTVRDITERKRAEEQLKESYRRLRETQAQLVQAGKLAAVGQLAAGVAHEINNPLAIVSTSAEIMSGLIGAGPPGPETAEILRKHLKKIEDNIFRCKSIIDDLLGFARREEESLVETDIAGLLRETIRMVENVMRGRERRLILTGKPLPARCGALEEAELRDFEANHPTPTVLRTWPRQLQQVFVNLLLNAMDATGPKGFVLMSVVRKDAGVEVSVGDNGTGIEPSHLEHIFEPFFTTKPVGKGTGLGLYLAHRIVTSLEGTIAVESELGGGTVIRVWLPLRAASAGRVSAVPLGETK